MEVNCPSLPEDMQRLSLEIDKIYSDKLEISEAVNCLTMLCDSKGMFQLHNASKRNKKRCAPKIDKSQIIEYHIPDYVPENEKVTKSRITKAKAAEEQTGKNDKPFDRLGKGQSSYRQLRKPFDLEPEVPDQFLLNHKFKIIQFGCASSVSQKISDDEGMTKKNLNPLYNSEAFNLVYDTLADHESRANMCIRRELLDIKFRPAIISDKCEVLDELKATFYSSIRLPKMQEISFNAVEPSDRVNYIEFKVITTMLSNLEMISKSLKIGNQIRTMLQAYKSIIALSLTKRGEIHFACDALGLKFVNVTQQLVSCLSKSFQATENYSYKIFMDFFLTKHICLNEILDDIEVDLAEHIENGSWFCRVMLQYREMACALDLNTYLGLFYDEISVIENTPEPEIPQALLNLARAYCNYGELYGVRFEFTKNGDMFIKVKKECDEPITHPVFPIFNMFDLNLESLERGETKQAFHFIPF